MPPAFALSQDQTLKLNSFPRREKKDREPSKLTQTWRTFAYVRNECTNQTAYSLIATTAACASLPLSTMFKSTFVRGTPRRTNKRRRPRPKEALFRASKILCQTRIAIIFKKYCFRALASDDYSKFCEKFNSYVADCAYGHRFGESVRPAVWLAHGRAGRSSLLWPGANPLIRWSAR